MLYVYDKTSKSIKPCKDTTLKDNLILERQDLEKWIEENPDMLGEQLLILTTEYDRFDKTNERLDLLAVDKEGNLVIIELKRDDSGKYVDLQALKYAAYCSTLRLQDVVELYKRYLAKKKILLSYEQVQQKILEFIENDEFEEINDKPRIILVSKEYKPEVTACVLWLRKFFIDVTCVKLTPYELDNGSIALDFSVLIPLPEAEEFQMQVERKENAENNLTVSQTEYIKFYTDLISRLRNIIGGEYKIATYQSYYSIPTTIPAVHYEWGFHGRPRSSFGVELHFEKGNRDLNVHMLQQIARRKKELEKQLHEEVKIVENWGQKWCRLYIQKQEGRMTEELKVWAVEKMATLIQLLNPEINKL